MDIEESPNCAKDRVTILDGNDVNAKSLGSYCGNKVPHTIQSSTEIVTIQFISDGTVIKKGFNLQYTLLKMGSLSNSFVGVLSTITNKASLGSLNFFQGCSITPLTIVKEEK